MQNLLHENLTLEQIDTILRDAPPASPLPPLGNPAWSQTSQKEPLRQLLPILRDRALAEAADPLPELTEELYTDYPRTGTRSRFEGVYFDRRRRLARAAIALLVESDPARQKRLTASLLDKMRDIFAETSWALPAHVANHPSGKNPEVIDLFAAETANLFAELLSVFAAIVPADLAAAIRQRLRTQIFENYLTDRHYWINRDSNWNAVCHQGVVGAALTIEDDTDLLSRMLHRTAQFLPNFLKGYGNDGATVEGPGYWAYGFGWFTELNAQLETRTRRELSLFHNNPKITAIARFGPATLLQNNFTINFSDGSPHANLRPCLLQYLADRLNDPHLSQHAASAWRNLPHQDTAPSSQLENQKSIDTFLNDHRADFFHLSRHILRAPAQTSPAANLPIQDVHWPDAQWLLSRIKTTAGHIVEFAAKAGHNDENHNHNDVGSWLLNIDGQRAFIEIGSPEYTREFFASNTTRYQNIAARSLGHPVPRINNIEQAHGRQFEAKDVQYQATPTQIHFSLDLAPAYPADAHVTRALRNFLFDKLSGSLTITDTFTLTQITALETALITQKKPTVDNGIALLKLQDVTAKITPGPNTLIKEVQFHPYNNHAAQPTQIHRLVLTPQSLSATTTLTYTVSLL